MPKVRADQVKRALAKKHSNNFFLTEVKTGSTWLSERGQLLRIDALAIKKSWAKPSITAYEVKVDRQDFLRDEKWPGYRNYSHRLYFACPTGMIQPEELPDDVGLIWFNPEKGTLYTKKKARFREIEIPGDMFYYILLSRVASDKHPFFSNEREALEAYVVDKIERKELGRKVSSKFSEEIDEAVRKAKKLERKLEDLEDDKEQFERLKNMLNEAGIRTYRWNLEEDLKQHLDSKVSPKVIEVINRMRNDALQLNELIKAK